MKKYLTIAYYHGFGLFIFTSQIYLLIGILESVQESSKEVLPPEFNPESEILCYG